MFAPEAKYGILSAQLAVHQARREADGRYESKGEVRAQVGNVRSTPKADIRDTYRHVRFGPIPEVAGSSRSNRRHAQAVMLAESAQGPVPPCG